ncbi:hypothetical protein EH223_05425 [candidate division KSB1 bacterium]|nr:YjbH domain-containing protein [candidate division KSB1 bacterium]RQW05203.1 MAG: hypothetical protein EH223_05425 [candidate division KSB1 bacterium]
MIFLQCSSRALLAIFIAIAVHSSLAQSLSGIPGLVYIPTAELKKDGVSAIGLSYIPKESLSYSRQQRDGLVVFASMTFLPFLEIDLRLTKQLGLAASERHTVDRSPSVRVKLVRERRTLPTILFGVHDIFSTVEHGQARHFGATYFVATKHFLHGTFMIAPTIGYGFEILESDQTELLGFFGGIKIRSAYFRRIALLVDYDTKYMNFAMDIYPLKSAQIKLALLNFRHFAANASMHFSLFDVF